jgi:hypothetical protein
LGNFIRIIDSILENPGKKISQIKAIAGKKRKETLERLTTLQV